LLSATIRISRQSAVFDLNYTLLLRSFLLPLRYRSNGGDQKIVRQVRQIDDRCPGGWRAVSDVFCLPTDQQFFHGSMALFCPKNSDHAYSYFQPAGPSAGKRIRVSIQ
jgi:hypothetical protein